MTSGKIWRRAVAGGLLLVALFIASRTIALRLVLSMASEHVATRWAFTLLVILAIGVECHLLGFLVHLIRAGLDGVRAGSAWGTETARARRRRRRLRMASIVCSIIVAFCISEVAFRVCGIDSRFDEMTNDDCSRKVDESLNALGIREDWDAIDQDDPRLRIAFLGDSFTFGYRVQRTDTFPHLIEGLLADDRQEGVLTINLGDPGTAPGTQLANYLKWHEALRPDVVVQVLYPNDLGVDLHFVLEELHAIRDADLWFGRVSRVLSFAETQARYWILWNKALGYLRGGRTSGEQEQSWAKFERDLRACKEAVEEGGAVYGCVLFPWVYRLDDYPLHDVHRRMAAIIDDMGVPFLDLLETYAKYPEESLRTCDGDDHPNPNGHRIAADRIARFVRERILQKVAKTFERKSDTPG